MKTILAAHIVLGLVVSSAACRKAAAPVPNSAVNPTAATPPGQAAAAAPVKPMPAQIPAVLARVNGEAIEKWEFDSAVKGLEARAGASVPADKRDEVLRGVLDRLVAFHLLAQEARNRKIEVTDAEVDARIGDIRRSFQNEQAFADSMSAQGLTVDRVRQQSRVQLQVSKFIDAEVATAASVQDSEIGAFYEQNLARFKQDESVHASHILIGAPENAAPAEKAEARSKAQSLLRKVRRGADFAAVARAESQDRGTAQNGGDLGFFTKGRMTPAFEATVFRLKAGEISGVVETPFGFHIIKMHERRAPHTATLAEVSGQIKQFLEQQRREEKLETFIEQVREKSKIDILV
jgi:peptidyl-prolyl cis-trans isomerase C